MKCPLLLLTLAAAVSLHAQEKLFEESIGWRGRSIELHTISDRGKHQACLFVCNEDSVRAYVLNSEQAVVQHFYFPWLNDELFLGGFIKDGTVYTFFQRIGSHTDLHVWTLDIARGSTNNFIIPFAMRHERAVLRINWGDHFLYFTANRKASEFVIYDFRENKACDTLRFHFGDGIFNALMNEHGVMNVAKVDPDEWMTPNLAHFPNKVYLMEDTLFLLMNNYERGVTAVFSVDMKTKKADFRKIRHNIVQQMNPPLKEYTDNSELLDAKLYFVSADNDKLDVQVRDFNSGKLLKDFRAGWNEDISFRNTPIFQSSSYTPTGALVRKMLDNGVGILATREDSGRVGVTIGAFEQKSALDWVPIPGILTIPGAILLIGITYEESDFSYTHMTSRFKMLVDSTTLEHVPGEIRMDIMDRIGQYKKEAGIRSSGGCLFRNGGRYVFAWYNRDERKIVVVGF